MNRKIIIIITVLLVLGAAGGAFAYYKHISKTPESLVTEATDTIPKKPEIIQTETVQSPYNITSYPQVVNYKDKTIEERVNTQIRKFFNDAACFLGSDDKETKDNLITLVALAPVVSSERIGADLESLSIPRLIELASSTNAYSYESGFDVTYSKNDILSISQSYSNYCGGPYPNDGIVTGITFDMRTGNKVEYGDLFADYEKTSPAISSRILSTPSVKDTVSDLVDECAVFYDPKSNDFDETHFQYADYYITQTGLFVIPSFPHVIKACEIDFEIPMTMVKEFIDPQGILSRI